MVRLNYFAMHLFKMFMGFDSCSYNSYVFASLLWFHLRKEGAAVIYGNKGSLGFSPSRGFKSFKNSTISVKRFVDKLVQKY